MRLFFVFILSFLICSCSLYKPLEFKGMEDYSFSEQDGCNPICVELRFFNPNPYKIVLKSANVKGLLGKEDIGVLEITRLKRARPGGIGKTGKRGKCSILFNGTRTFILSRYFFSN